ncbi:hypothetical protein H310_09757 [Aphanomyces invadans]|uniref:Uncharacterized protein n=1 Tax=Aphanomyces invadans TaxID=157072 RepID=A0A024TVT6_9STRA|nr:hypothetical protein H310_09757 [Aphanomyces invadans]ETV97427.1 hypothetical protein H310_09757 [Aphanomyces invadans]|eukprot:XP_008874135.1 hypothetical protein H310_09757 [Aphanomyces invadans]
MKLGIPRRTIRAWANNRWEILAYEGNKKRMKIEPGGRTEKFPDPAGLETFINDMRVQERALTMTHIINWIKCNQAEWLRAYIAHKKPGTGYQGLLRLLQRFCKRHGFSRQKAGKSKHKQRDLKSKQHEFAEEYHHKWHWIGSDCTYNVDETGFYYDMPPKYIWAVRGGDAKIATGEKHLCG